MLAGEGEDVAEAVASSVPEGVEERDATCVAEPVPVDVKVGLALAPWLPLEVADTEETWLGLKLAVTLGLGVSVNTIETLCDGVTDPVELSEPETLGVAT